MVNAFLKLDACSCVRKDEISRGCARERGWVVQVRMNVRERGPNTMDIHNGVRGG